MGDYSSTGVELEGEDDLITAAKQIVKALGSKKNLSSDAAKVLEDLGMQLTAMAAVCDKQPVEAGGSDDERLDAIQKKIMSWELDHSMICDTGHDELLTFLDAADEARILIERLESLGSSQGEEEKELLQRAYSVLQSAMERTEEEFKYILVHNRQPYEPGQMSFRSSEDDAADLGSIVSLGDDSIDDFAHRDSVSRTSEEFIVDLVNPGVISDLKSIVNLMFSSHYGHECSISYVTARRDALDECLFILNMDKLSVEDVLKLEWSSLHSKMKRWVRVAKVFVRVYLASEKWLTEHLFGGHGEEAHSACFAESSKASILQLLNFGEAISIGPHKPEKLYLMLEMYEVLADLLPDIDSLFSGEAGLCVRNYSYEVLRRLGESIKVAFIEFENAVATNGSTNPLAGGGIHQITRYVMNYMNTLVDYQERLDFLLQDNIAKGGYSDSSIDKSPSAKEETSNGTTYDVSPMAVHFRSLTSILECNLNKRAQLYRDVSLQHIFLMNNIHYMSQKVKNSELRLVFGDDWIRKLNWKFQQHATNYERATWSSVLLLLKEESRSNSSSKTLMKERIRNFYLAFEEVYQTQTAWTIPDDHLREDLRISISLKVIQAYRPFAGRIGNQISDKFIKYSAEDLQNLLLDLFKGSPMSLHNPHRK